MRHPTLTRRATLTALMSGVASLSAAVAVPRRAWAFAQPVTSAGDGVLQIDFDNALYSRVSRNGQAVTPLEASEGVRLAGGKVIDRFVLLDRQQTVLPNGKRYSFRGLADGWLEKQVEIEFREAYPGAALMTVRYRNVGRQPMTIARWWTASHTLLAHPKGAWTFSGSSHPDRRDWVQPVTHDFQQRNFMGMNGSDYGGGTPMSVVWRPDFGLAVA
ncbi:MAG: alpha-galactosidase, partial [Sphingomonas sp.]|nr:alpha-galactosidase [Sphingomonas sp.]